jgi:serine protease Do
MMLGRDTGGTVAFLGTAFVVHRQGYLLTAAHLTTKEEGLMLIPSTLTDEFVPLSFDRVAAMAVQVVSRDVEHDVALLRIEQDMNIGVPDDFLGSTSAVRPGASVMSLGYSFGHQQMHTLLGYNAVVSAKIRSVNDTALILFDTAFHEGDRGGPLIHVADGHIVGIVTGRFEPSEIAHQIGNSIERLEPRETNVSYAVALEYGLDLMRKQELINPPGTL